MLRDADRETVAQNLGKLGASHKFACAFLGPEHAMRTTYVGMRLADAMAITRYAEQTYSDNGKPLLLRLLNLLKYVPEMRDVFDAVTARGYTPARPEPAPRPLRVYLSRLPVTGAQLVGRKRQLDLLDQRWEDPKTHIFSFVAGGDMGKSALVNHWLGQMARDGYRGARAIFGWSFYSQGTAERRAASATSAAEDAQMT